MKADDCIYCKDHENRISRNSGDITEIWKEFSTIRGDVRTIMIKMATIMGGLLVTGQAVTILVIFLKP